MSVGTLVPVEEYLGTAYHPDVEYVDGVIVERNVGDYLRSKVQGNVVFAFQSKYPDIEVLPEMRSMITGTKYRIPDVTVLLRPPATRFLIDAAYIAIEILSYGDDMSHVVEKLEEYAAKGVASIWLIDPRLRRMHVYMDGNLLQVTDKFATRDGIELTREEIFRRLDHLDPLGAPHAAT